MSQLTELGGEPDHELAQVLDRLGRRYPGLSQRWLAELARAAHEGFSDAPVRTFVPLLVEHQVVTAVRQGRAAHDVTVAVSAR